MNEHTASDSAPAEPSSRAVDAASPLGFLMDVRLQVSVELGRRRFRIADLLSLNQGSILELDKVAGEPLDIRVNDHLIARGEAVVVNDKFGVRLTEVITPVEKMGKLL
ncbi:MAG: flagellar motor switch protein FliN/FliY [Myxococcota bacterium]